MIDDHAIEMIRQRIPDAEIIFAKGSATGSTMTPWSDIDFDVLVGEGDETWLWWLDDDDNGRIRHISVALMSTRTWEVSRNEPQDWALGFAVEAPVRLIWARNDELRRRFELTTVGHPAGTPELEDLVESLGKARTGAAARDALRFWPAIYDIGRLAPGVLRPFNPQVRVATRREALVAALAMPDVPVGWRETLVLCLGIEGNRHDSDMEPVLLSVTSLVYGIIALLSAKPRILLEEAFDPGDIDLLTGGRLIRYLRQDEPERS